MFFSDDDRSIINTISKKTFEFLKSQHMTFQF